MGGVGPLELNNLRRGAALCRLSAPRHAGSNLRRTAETVDVNRTQTHVHIGLKGRAYQDLRSVTTLSSWTVRGTSMANARAIGESTRPSWHHLGPSGLILGPSGALKSSPKPLLTTPKLVLEARGQKSPIGCASLLSRNRNLPFYFWHIPFEPKKAPRL